MQRNRALLQAARCWGCRRSQVRRFRNRRNRKHRKKRKARWWTREHPVQRAHETHRSSFFQSRSIYQFFIISVLLFACTPADSTDADNSGFDEAAAEFALVQCESACDSQLRWECHDTTDFQWCDRACKDAAPDDAESYARCVSASDFCDADCDAILESTVPSEPPTTNDVQEPSCFDECVSFAQTCDPDMADICGPACNLADELVMGCIDSASGCTLTPTCEELIEGN